MLIFSGKAMREPDLRDEQWFRFPRFFYVFLFIILTSQHRESAGHLTTIMRKKFFINLFLSALLSFLCFQGMAQHELGVGIIIVEDIGDDDPDLLSKSAVVSDDVYYNGKILIAAGTPVIMDIQYQRNRGLGVPATVSAKPVSTTDIYGQVWPLYADARTMTGKDRHGAAIGCGVAFGIVTFPVGLLFLCIKGGDVEIEEDTQMAATIKVK